MAAAEHWDFVYASNTDDQLSWFQDEPTTSLRLLFAAAGQDASVIDAGAGTSRLAAALLGAGWSDLTVLDVSAEALAAAHGNDGDPRLSAVIADVRTWQPERAWTLWHDRAVFHFLVAPGDRARYIAAATRAVTVGGAAVIGTFAPDGPTQCSGLPTARYDPETLADLFKPGFVVEHSETQSHVTPAGTTQTFTWVILRRVDTITR